MLKSRYHAVFLGLTPYSLIHALLLRGRGQDVLVVDDVRLSTDTTGLRRLTVLDSVALGELGVKHQLGPLQQLKNFLRPSTVSIHLPGLQWVSGASVQDNLREFVRKFAFLQTPLLLEALARPAAELDTELERAAVEFLHWFNSPLVRTRSVAPFAGTSFAWINEFHRLISQEHARDYQGPGVALFTQLLAAYCASTDQVVKYDLSHHEAWAVGIRLLSPVWELDRRWFERELMRELADRGGHTKKTSINSWQIYQDRVEAALLDSYEGVISHDRMLVYGLPPLHGQLQCHFDVRTFRGIEFAQKAAPMVPLAERADTELMAFSSSEQMGTIMPVGLLEKTGNESRLVALVALAPGAKLEFSHHDAWQSLAAHLKRAIPFDDLALSATVPRGSWGHWIEEGPEKLSPKAALMHHERRKVAIVDRVSRTPLTGVEFWGPLRTRRFGHIGFLADLRADQS